MFINICVYFHYNCLILMNNGKNQYFVLIDFIVRKLKRLFNINIIDNSLNGFRIIKDECIEVYINMSFHKNNATFIRLNTLLLSCSLIFNCSIVLIVSSILVN